MSVLFLAKLKGRERLFLGRSMEGCWMRLTQIALRFFKRLKKSLSFVKFEKIPPPPLLFLEPLTTTKYCRVWRSVINFVDRFQEVGEESSLYQGGSLIIMSPKRHIKGKMCGGHDTAILTMPYLKVLLIVWFHKTFKLIFLKQPSQPKNNLG